MRVLVTGHQGYIGTVLVPMLSAAGHEVTGLDSDLYARCTFGTAQQVGLRLEDFEGPRYKRIDHIKHLLHTELLDATLRWKQRQTA